MSEFFPNLSELRPAILERLHDFSLVPKSRWQREVMLCLLTPQSSPLHAEVAMNTLEGLGFFEQEIAIEAISAVLRNPHSYVRFHNVKAKRLYKLREQWQDILHRLQQCSDALSERRVLYELVEGFGLKEASHALRNIGRRNLSILDRHILRELQSYGVIKVVPTSISEKIYFEIEEAFRAFALTHDEDLDVLDLYFWSKRTGFIFK